VDDISKRIGAFFKTRRKELGLTQVQLARKVKLSRSCIASIETGRQGIVLSQVPAFIQALKIDRRELGEVIALELLKIHRVGP